MYSILFHYFIRSIGRFFEKNRLAKVVTVFGFAVALAFLATVVYYGFRSGFHHVAKDAFFGDALFLYIIELFLLVSFVLVVASALMSGIFLLFRSEGEGALMASPRHLWKPVFVFLRMFLSSLWPLLAIILPALLAVWNVYGLPPLGFVLTVLSVTILIALGAIGGMALLLFAAWVLYFLGNRSARFVTRRNLTLLVGAVFLGKLIVLWERMTTVDLVRFFQARHLDVATPDLSPIIDQFHILPTHFSAMTLYLSRTGDTATATSYVLYSIVFLAISLLVLYALGRRHLILWELFQEHIHSRLGLTLSAFGTRLLCDARTGGQAIVGKEIIAFMRNSRGLLWFGFILLIWFMQTGASKILSRGLGAERVTADALPSFVGMFQFAVIVYFVSMFVLRFTFPSFSSERKTAWLIGAAPVDLGIVFVSKLRFFVGLFSFLAILFALFNITAMDLSASFGALLVLFLTIATLFLTSYGLSLGAIFPNFESDDPEVLSTTMPGLGFIFGALCYGALGAYTLGITLRSDNFLPLFLFAVCSVLGAMLLARLAHRSLGHMEF
ncbi:MAG: hypothetical protein A3D65_03365 [Candidatus Lloydbacteria bacterium RIFCSPHIGHO2_02_FULL_50_13]|uniref:Uncharacterized protein n=1 Tax=Candidatus Lloydbacteria bacterium RIFCSPHIGHO2_02_FULL_50_13 TaxID=1798661 RepID=A0A1G2D9P2_9BACT|nr:MAG: hypothetical protein A3D65_03365 [Candidatus Lloydbacteria bacterium RIFCSPHIGHO2_02_FULL_50_13]